MSRTPKLEVPVSASTTSPALKKSVHMAHYRRRKSAMLVKFVYTCVLRMYLAGGARRLGIQKVGLIDLRSLAP